MSTTASKPIVHTANLPFEIRIESWTKRELIDGTGYQFPQGDHCRANGDEAGAMLAEEWCDLLWQEIDGRNQAATERNARKLAWLRAKADALRVVSW